MTKKKKRKKKIRSNERQNNCRQIEDRFEAVVEFNYQFGFAFYTLCNPPTPFYIYFILFVELSMYQFYRNVDKKY